MEEYRFTIYEDVNAFLEKTQAILEANESANSLMLGICIRLQRGANTLQDPPLLLVGEKNEEIVLISVMTPPFNLIFAYLPDQDLQAVKALSPFLRQTEWKVPGTLGPVETAETFSKVYSGSYTLQVEERIHQLNVVVQPDGNNGTLICAMEEHHELILGWANAFHAEATPDDPSSGLADSVIQGIKAQEFFILQDADGNSVSMLKKTRPTRNTITINFVYTPPELRGNGYASEAVAALSQQLLDEGYSFCILFTDLANPTSNSIYKKIGYKPVVDFNLYSFGA